MSLRPFRARCCSGTGNHTKTRTNERHQQNHEAVPSAPPGLTTPSGSSERLLAPSDRREKAKPLDAVARSPGAYKILFSGIPLFLLHFLTRTLPHRLRFNGQGIKVTHVHPRDLTLATSPSRPHPRDLPLLSSFCTTSLCLSSLTLLSSSARSLSRPPSAALSFSASVLPLHHLSHAAPIFLLYFS